MAYKTAITITLGHIYMWLSELFKDTSIDKVSHMRVMSSIVIIIPILTWCIYVFINGWVDPGESLAFLVLGALGSKAAQKWVENKKDKNGLGE